MGLRHLQPVLAAPAGSGARGLHRRLRHGVLLEHRGQPLEQACFVAVAEGELHLPTADGEVTIDTRWGLWQPLERVRAWGIVDNPPGCRWAVLGFLSGLAALHTAPYGRTFQPHSLEAYVPRLIISPSL